MHDDSIEQIELGEICDFTQGVQIAEKDTFKDPDENRIRYIYIRDLFSDKYPVYVKDEYPNKVLTDSDIVMVNTGNTSGAVYRGRSGVLCNNAFTISLKSHALNEIDTEFLWQYLNSDARDKMLRRLFNPAGQPHVGHKNVARLRIPKFPKNEQTRIAGILSAWDSAIQTIEKLIENGEQQKKALMQRLLRPDNKAQTTWQTNRLADVAQILISNVNKKSAPDEQTIRLCNYTDVYYNDYITGDADFMTATASPTQIKKFALKRGDILITKDSETPGDIAVPAMVNADFNDVVCGYHLAIIRPKVDVDSTYLRSLFSLDSTQHYFFTRANGATRFGLTISAIEEAVVMLPPLATQREATRIIRVAENIIRTYKENLARLKQEKAALMQQLLTGKRRVHIDQTQGEAACA